MTVAELIARLADLPGEAVVLSTEGEYDDPYEVEPRVGIAFKAEWGDWYKPDPGAALGGDGVVEVVWL